MPKFTRRSRDIIKHCDKILERGTVSEYAPDDTGKTKVEYENFKNDYLGKLPNDAKTAAEEIKEKIDQLELDAEDIKEKYKAQKEVYEGLMRKLNNDGLPSPFTDKGAMAKQMKKSLKGISAESFDITILPADPEKQQKLAEAKAQFIAAMEFYNQKDNKKLANKFSGKWMDELKAACSKMDSKIDANIEEAKSEYIRIGTEMDKFSQDLGGLESASGAEKVDILIAMAEKFKGASASAEAERQQNRTSET